MSQSAMRSFVPFADDVGGLQEVKYLNPIRRNTRENLKRLSDNMPIDADAHHVLAQKFIKDFLREGINIHDPKYLVWWEKSAHRRAAKGYNEKWQAFFRAHPEATDVQMLEEGKRIMNMYGIPTNY